MSNIYVGEYKYHLSEENTVKIQCNKSRNSSGETPRRQLYCFGWYFSGTKKGWFHQKKDSKDENTSSLGA